MHTWMAIGSSGVGRFSEVMTAMVRERLRFTTTGRDGDVALAIALARVVVAEELLAERG